MQNLTSKQRSYLKSQANALRPLLQIGKSGVTQEVIQSIAMLLDQHELLKVKFIAFKEEKQPLLDQIILKSGAAQVSVIGHVLTLYRQQADPEKRHYNLPA